MSNLVYKTPILKFKIPKNLLPVANTLISSILSDMKTQCPVDTGVLQASIMAHVSVKKV